MTIAMIKVSRDEFYEVIGAKDVVVSAHGNTVTFKLRYGQIVGKTVEDHSTSEYWLEINFKNKCKKT